MDVESIWGKHVLAVRARGDALKEIGRIRFFEAIANTTQVLAHDVRKPFSLFRSIVETVEDTVLPNPMGRTHFLKLMLASLPEKPATTSAIPANVPANISENTLVRLEPRKFSVAVLSDTIAMQIGWERKLANNAHVRSFGSTGEFFETCENEPSYLSTLDVVVTDDNFAPEDPHDGGSLARTLREQGYGGLILRSSNAFDLGVEIEALFDGDLGADALAWPEFKAVVEAAQARRMS